MLKRFLVSICNRMVGKPVEDSRTQWLEKEVARQAATITDLIEQKQELAKELYRVESRPPERVEVVVREPTFTMTHKAYMDLRKQFLPPIVQNSQDDASYRLGIAAVLMYIGDNHVAR